MRKLIAVAVLGMVLAGCQSDEAKLRKLRANAVEARERVSQLEQVWDSIVGGSEVQRISLESERDMRLASRLSSIPMREQADSFRAIEGRMDDRERRLRELQARTSDPAVAREAESAAKRLESARVRAILAEREVERFLQR